MAVPSLLMHSVKCTENLVKFVFAICDCTDITQACLSAILFCGAEYIVISRICLFVCDYANEKFHRQCSDYFYKNYTSYIILHIKKISVHNLCETDNTRKWH